MTEITVVGNTDADLHFGLGREFLHRAEREQSITLPFGSKLEAEEYQLTVGGSGANVAVGAVKAGLATTFITGVSTDPLGEFLLQTLKSTKLRLQEHRSAAATNISVILRVGSERTIITAHTGGADYLTAELPTVGHLHLGPIAPENDDCYGRLVSHVAKTSQPFSLNPRLETLKTRPRHFQLALRLAKILFVNQEEAQALTRLPGRTTPEELIRAMQDWGIPIVAVTCGTKGAYLGSPAGLYSVASLTGEGDRVDATGAGDAFTSGFLAGYLAENETDERLSVERGLAYAALNAASVVGQIGGQAGLIGAAELERDWRTVRLKKHD